MKLHELKKIAQELRVLPQERDSGHMARVLREMGLEPGNIYQELEMTSRYVDTHRDVSDSGAQVMLHSHNFCEVLYCRHSGGAEYIIGSDRYRLQKGDIIFVPPGISHRPILPENMEGAYIRDVIWISTEFLETVARVFPELSGDRRVRRAPIRTANTRWESIGDLFRAGVKEAEAAEPGWEAAVMGNTIMIIARLRRAYMESSAGILEAEKRDLLDDVRAYMERHFSEHLTLSDIARRFYVSESSVSHLFRQKMGVSVYRYITQRRLIEAKTLIQEGTSLEAAAGKVGFSDYSGFYRAFRQEYGISPREYKKLLITNSRQAEEGFRL